MEIDDAFLIIDDWPGRRIATTLGLRCTGTLGLLVTSKRAGHVARLLGHAHPAVVEAVERQARKGTSSMVLNEPAIELAEAIVPAGPVRRADPLHFDQAMAALAAAPV